MKSNYDIIKRPIITEKSSGLVEKLKKLSKKSSMLKLKLLEQ